ncbi:MAG TPA: ABC transporter ATP-binding protein [Casimicrobiaceae bacterium]|jgi:NitT/TauT family transport system ATP-binding protein|nr:ABC transporter ATP-binding protein [Casimicrobiaceae bacterium]
MTGKIDAQSLSKTYVSARSGERVEALQNVSFSVAPHEFVSIVGPSGCGKSTLLALVAGFVAPTSGRVLADGAPITGPDPRRGVMFQDYALFPWRTVLGNVEFGPLARGATREAMRATAHRYIELVGLEGFEHRYPHELSGGMRQRCALARLLANEPEVWLMDEPLAAVDLQTRNILQDELLRLWGDGGDPGQRRAVLFVTHGIDEAVYLSDRVIVLGRRPGRIKETVTIDLPRPRKALRNSAEAGRYNEYIWNLIRDEAARAIVEESA